MLFSYVLPSILLLLHNQRSHCNTIHKNLPDERNLLR